jgi:succinoglycan biosynthesis protein ExoM
MKICVSICVCTFKREALFATLLSLSDLEDISDYEIDVVVSDNDEQDIIRSKVAEFAESFRFPIKYVHAPAKNISVARNAALDNVTGRWAAFIDDDEVAAPAWLSELLQVRDGAVAILGQCIATFSPDLPQWLSRCDFHSNVIKDDPINGYTSNVLLDVDFLRTHQIRFRHELGQTGGEDTIFFREIDRAGGRIVYRPESIVYEPVVPSRANMTWVRRRKFRAGQTHGLLCREFAPSQFRWLLVTAGAKAAMSFLMSILTIPGSDRSRLWHARGFLHLGAFKYRLKPDILNEYG